MLHGFPPVVLGISTGILGFQGATLAVDLLNCTALSWLYVRMNGLPALCGGWTIQADPAMLWIQMGPPEKVRRGQTDNELIPNQTETCGSCWGDLNI